MFGGFYVFSVNGYHDSVEAVIERLSKRWDVSPWSGI